MTSIDIDEADLSRWDREHLWHAFTQMADYRGPIIERAQGCYLETVDGQRILDGVSSMWCITHGHNHQAINAAIAEQLAKVSQVSLLGMASRTTVELARRLSELTDHRLPHAFFSSDGSCAVEVALKMAFQYWRQRDGGKQDRDLFIAAGGAYHGDTLGSVSVGGVSRFQAMFRPLLFECVQGPMIGAARPYHDQEERRERLRLQYEKLLSRYAGRIAAIVVEPIIQAAAGMMVAPVGFLSDLRELATRYDTLLIADEIATGVGKTGRMLACDLEGVTPDLLCLGKGLSGGYLPLAVTLASRDIHAAFLGEYRDSRSFFHGHTFGGNPLASAASLANLKLFEEERTLEHVGLASGWIGDRLRRLAEFEHVANPRHVGVMAAFDLVRDPSTREPYAWEDRLGGRLCERLLARGVWLRPLGSTVVIMPPLGIARPEIDHIFDALEGELQTEGWG